MASFVVVLMADVLVSRYLWKAQQLRDQWRGTAELLNDVWICLSREACVLLGSGNVKASEHNGK